ncbi:MAG TPA: 6-carboxytetrahydropterin synthase [Bacteroidales bacterium]|nr:6-carboxytetrahydropterin synthase [Bacteroidales bacterium]HPI68019.1 6-carboxytetrahydropterin synthase [Bacteroidales bacterium]HPR72464.1 6-carboxytetrahydropterin synthase [Bacteroidales bacterium]
MIYLTRRERFSAAHRIYRQEWKDEQNLKIFGKCSNPHWHGHNYELFVTVKGEISEDHGCVIKMDILKEIIHKNVINKLDHKNMNLEVDFMKGKIATTENLVAAIWDELKGPVEKEGASLHCIRVKETENNSVEYYG